MQLFVVEGPVGAGKSTYAAKLALEHGAVHLDLDEWMVTLFRPDRPETDFMAWYGERKLRCIDQIWLLTCHMLDMGVTPVLELGLVRLADREELYRRLDATDYSYEIHLLDVPKAVRYERVQQRNAEQAGTFKMEVTDEIFEIANAAWEPPGDAETEERNIRWIAN